MYKMTSHSLYDHDPQKQTPHVFPVVSSVSAGFLASFSLSASSVCQHSRPRRCALCSRHILIASLSRSCGPVSATAPVCEAVASSSLFIRFDASLVFSYLESHLPHLENRLPGSLDVDLECLIGHQGGRPFVASSQPDLLLSTKRPPRCHNRCLDRRVHVDVHATIPYFHLSY